MQARCKMHLKCMFIRRRPAWVIRHQSALLWRVFLFPGDIACAAIGLDRDDKRELVRMLVNSLVWIVVGMLVVAVVT